MTARINVLKIAFGTAALALVVGALAVSTSSSTATAGAPGTASAATGGKTVLKPTKQMIRKLKRARVTVKPTGSAKGGLRKLAFPITGGQMGDDPYLGGLPDYLRHRGSGFRIMKRVDGTSSDLPPRCCEIFFRNPVVDLDRNLLGWVLDGPPDFAPGIPSSKVKTSASGDGTEVAPYGFPLFRLSGIFDTNPEDGATRHRFRAQAKFTARGARAFRSWLGLNVKKGTTFGFASSTVLEWIWADLA